MIALALPEPLMWGLRWLLFLGPLAAVLALGRRNMAERRRLVGGLFAFLYGLGLIFATHQLALWAGWWRYGGDVLMIMGMPADIWFGGALLFGPVLFFLFPNTGALWLCLPIVIGLHGTVFSSLQPLVRAGSGWFGGVILVFLLAHIPAITLARWTAERRHLGLRASLLAVGYGCLAFWVLPSLIMHAFGGGWDLASRPLWLLALCAPFFALCVLLGLAAVQAFVVEGKGTPIPLDPTERLVTTGIFAFVTNPMQVSTAAAWIVAGIALADPWVASASIMAWVFVQGMVRWHHRHDLLKRFPEGWPTYRANVPEWRPRWTPWVPEPACLLFDPRRRNQARIASWLRKRRPTGLEIEEQPGLPALRYANPAELRPSTGLLALAKALGHVNFAFALAGAAILLTALPLCCLQRKATAAGTAKTADEHA